MHPLPFLTCLVLASFAAEARARESVSTQAVRVQGLLRQLQDPSKLKDDLILSLRPTVAMSQMQLAREQLNPGMKPGHLPAQDPRIVIAHGQAFVLPKIPGQRSCEAIHKDWRLLDRVYQEVSGLALELEEVYSHPSFCAPCADSVLTTLQQATAELEAVSNRLNRDGERQLIVVWGPQALQHDRENIVTALSWDHLISINIDGHSQAGDATHPLPLPPGLILRSPLLQHGIQFQTEVTAERVCSPGFELRLDALATGLVSAEEGGVDRDSAGTRLRKLPLTLILVSSW